MVGLLGAAIGTAVRSQTIALLIPPVWMLVIETLLPSYGLDGVLLDAERPDWRARRARLRRSAARMGRRRDAARLRPVLSAAGCGALSGPTSAEAVADDADPASNRDAEADDHPVALDPGCGTLAATAVQALQPVYKSGRDGDPTLGTVVAELAVLEALGRGALVALLLGVLMVTSEFRHNTVTASLLESPRRGRG